MTNYYEHLLHAHERNSAIRNLLKVCKENDVKMLSMASGMVALSIDGISVISRLPKRVPRETFRVIFDGVRCRNDRQRVRGGSLSWMNISYLAKPDSLLSWEQWVERTSSIYGRFLR